MAEGQAPARGTVVLLVGAGGFAGANLRYLVEVLIPGTLLATFLVNVAGSFVLGLLLYETVAVGNVSQRVRIVLGTGFLSSFTTYSTFVIDTVTTAPLLAVGYVVASYAVGFSAVVCARSVIERYAGWDR